MPNIWSTSNKKVFPLLLPAFLKLLALKFFCLWLFMFVVWFLGLHCASQWTVTEHVLCCMEILKNWIYIFMNKLESLYSVICRVLHNSLRTCMTARSHEQNIFQERALQTCFSSSPSVRCYWMHSWLHIPWPAGQADGLWDVWLLYKAVWRWVYPCIPEGKISVGKQSKILTEKYSSCKK